MTNQSRQLLTRYIRPGWLVALILLLLAIFSPWGAIKYYQLESNIEEVSRDNQKLREDNLKLQTEIEKLTSDPAYIEKIAREEYGLIRNNEIIYQFPKSRKEK